MLAIVPETGREVNGGCESAQKGEKKSPLFWGRGGWERLFPALLERAGTRASRVGGVVGFLLRRWNGREPWPARPGPHFLERNGGKNPRGRRFLPRDPLLWWGCGGEAVPLTGYPACGPHSERLVTARPPAGRAGVVSGYPLGEGREKPFHFPLISPVNKPLLPPARAGGRAMRRWSWRPQARPIPDQPPSPIPPTREWGSKGKEPPSPWCSFPYFFKEIGPRPGGPRSPPVPTAKERNRKPPVRASPAQTAPPPAPRTAGRRDG